MRKLLFTLCVSILAVDVSLPQGTTAHASVAYDGGLPNFASRQPALSMDGQTVAFESEAGNLVFPFDHNNFWDVYVFVPASGATERISMGLGGLESNQSSHAPALSEDGRFVAFHSFASNLIAFDQNGLGDVFVADRQTGQVELISVGLSGASANADSMQASISADGRYVAFASGASDLVLVDAPLAVDIFVRDRKLQTTTLVSATWNGATATNSSFAPCISANGRVVAFHSYAQNMVPNNSANLVVAVRDLVAGTTLNACQGFDGSPSMNQSVWPVLSADGRLVAFHSNAPNLVPNDQNGLEPDTFLFDTQSGTMEIASQSASGAQGPTYPSFRAHLSADGRFVSFISPSNVYAAGDTNDTFDVFVRDRLSNSVLRASLGQQAQQGEQPSLGGSLSADGKHVGFYSSSLSFVDQPAGLVERVFVRTLAGASPQVYCTAKINSQGCLPQVQFTGSPSASLLAPFRIQARFVLNNKPGLLFYGLAFQTLPFQGGTLCVESPLVRTAVQFAGGNPPPDDCSGLYSFDFNDYIQSGSDPRLVAGTLVDAQYWMRDPLDPSGFTSGLSDALHFAIEP